MEDKLKIIFFGEDSFSNVVLSSLIKANYRILAVITPYYENLIHKRLEITCKTNNISFKRFHKINSEEVYNLMSKMKPDLCVITHFEKLISAKLLSIPRLGFINLHPSLLPFYRGMAPQHWPIINGEKETGLSVHYVDEGVDTGDIIIQERIPITSDMYVSDLQNIWLKRYPCIMLHAIERILRGEQTIRQRELKGCYFGKLKKEDCCVSINMSVHEAYNLVRGVSLPYCGANFEDIIIYRAHVNEDEELTNRFKEKNNGLYEDFCIGKLLRFNDGILIIDKYKTV